MMGRKLLFLLVFFITSVVLFAAEQKNVLILHSYSQEYLWTKSQHDAFVQHLQENVKDSLEISTEYLDTKRVKFSEEYQRKFVEYIDMKYKDFSPHVIYVTDDNALNFILKNNHTLFFDVPVVFSGINNLDLQKNLDPKRFTGVYEIKNVQQNIELIKAFSPQTKEIYFLGDATETYDAIEEELKTKQINFPNMKFYFIHAKKFSEVQAKLQKLPNRSFVLLTTIGGFEMENGVNQTLQYTINQLSAIKNIILMSMEDAYIQNNVIGGYVTHGAKQGNLAAQKAHKILQNISVENIESTTKDANVYMFSRTALLTAQIYLPEPIKLKSIIINEEISFYIRYKKEILNTFFIIFISLLIFIVLVYFISREKKQELLQNINNLLLIQKKLQTDDKIVKNIQALTHTIYWELDIQSSKICLTNTTDIKLALHDQTEISYDDFFNYLIHPSDFYLLKETIKETIESSKSTVIAHKVLLNDSSYISVINSFEYFSSSEQEKKIIGLIKLADSAE